MSTSVTPPSLPELTWPSRIELFLQTIVRILKSMHDEQKLGNKQQLIALAAILAATQNQGQGQQQIVTVLQQLVTTNNQSLTLLEQLAGPEDTEVNTLLKQLIALLTPTPPPPPQPASFTATITVD